MGADPARPRDVSGRRARRPPRLSRSLELSRPLGRIAEEKSRAGALDFSLRASFHPVKSYHSFLPVQSMSAFLAAVLSFPTVVFTVLLSFFVLYSLATLLGAADIE